MWVVEEKSGRFFVCEGNCCGLFVGVVIEMEEAVVFKGVVVFEELVWSQETSGEDSVGIIVFCCVDILKT